MHNPWLFMGNPNWTNLSVKIGKICGLDRSLLMNCCIWWITLIEIINHSHHNFSLSSLSFFMEILSWVIKYLSSWTSSNSLINLKNHKDQGKLAAHHTVVEEEYWLNQGKRKAWLICHQEEVRRSLDVGLRSHLTFD